ncbi:hypothetical protein [Nonomuraea jabiensis]|uniref:hypothetical protein n=1 Tax=Nonomuraea jabiensis TaxID=882448 RepID=UPI003D72E1A0
MANLATHPSVARALARKTVALHGWAFDIATGRLEELDATGVECIARGLTFNPPPARSPARRRHRGPRTPTARRCGHHARGATRQSWKKGNGCGSFSGTCSPARTRGSVTR